MTQPGNPPNVSLVSWEAGLARASTWHSAMTSATLNCYLQAPRLWTGTQKKPLTSCPDFLS